ncbi:MAG: hypothetical protein AAGK04_10185, partial [Planctomycetota bacterium]
MVRTNMMWSAVLLVLAGLGAAWLRLGAATPEVMGPAPIRLVTPEEIEGLRSIEVISGDGAASRVERVEGVGWLAPGDAGARWPVRAETLQGFLGMLSRERARPTEASSQPITRTLRLRGEGDGVSVEFAGEGTGGLWAVRIERGGERAWAVVDGDLGAIVRSGLEAWRASSLAPTPPGRSVEIDLRSLSGTIRLARSENGWRLTEPGPHRATAASADRIVAALSGTEVVSWEAAAVDEETPPVATITVAWDAFGEEGRRWRQDVVIHGAGDAEATTLIATSTLHSGDEVVWGPMTARVASTALSALSTAPEAYLPRRPIGVGADAVVRAEISRPDGADVVALQRAPGGWTVASRADWSPDVEAWRRALGALTSPVSSGVALRRPEGVGPAVARVRVSGSDDADMTVHTAEGDATTA